MADKNDSRKEKRIVNFDRGDELSRELSAGRDQDIEKQAKSEVKDTGVPDFSMGDAYTSECENRFSNTSEKKISEATSLSMGKPQESAEQGDTAVTSLSAESPPDREVEMGISDEYAKQMINKSEAYDDIEAGPRLKNFEQVYGEIIARDLKRKSEEGEDGYPDEEDVPEASAAEQYEYIDEKYRSQTLTGDEDENKCEEDISEIFSNEVNTEKLEEMDDVEIPPLKVPRDELYRMDMPSLSGKKNGDKGVNEPKKKKKRKKKRYILKFSIAFAFIAVILMFMNTDLFDIKKIEVRGNKSYTGGQIIQKTGIKTGDNIFGTRCGNAEDLLLADAYFKEADISRTLPSTIEINVKERSLAASVKYKDKYLCIDENGKLILTMDKRRKKLTMLAGIKVVDVAAGEILIAKNAGDFKRSLKILRAMKTAGLHFKIIEISKTESHAYVKKHLYCRGEADVITEVIENGSLKKVLDDLKSRGKTKGVITITKNNYISYNPKGK